MDSPVRKMQKRNDYNRHKLLRKIKRRRLREQELLEHVAEKKLKKKLKIPKYEDGKDNFTWYTQLNPEQLRLNGDTGDWQVLGEDGTPIVNNAGYKLPDLVVRGLNIKKANDEAALQRAFLQSEIWNGVPYPGHGALKTVSPEFDALMLGRLLYTGLIMDPNFRKEYLKQKNIIKAFDDVIGKDPKASLKGMSGDPGDLILIYNSNPRLMDAGSLWEYQDYVDQIFPKSMLYSPQYHGGPKNISRFLRPGDKGYIHTSGAKKFGTKDHGIYFAQNLQKARMYAQNSHGKIDPNNDIYAVKLNAQSPYDATASSIGGLEEVPYATRFAANSITDKWYNKLLKDKYDSVIDDWETAVFNPEQIHILGNHNDVVGFQNFIKSGKPKTPFEGFSFPKKQPIRYDFSPKAIFQTAKQTANWLSPLVLGFGGIGLTGYAVDKLRRNIDKNYNKRATDREKRHSERKNRKSYSLKQPNK